MAWEILRDVGLLLFVCGGVVVFVVFALRGFLQRYFASPDVVFVAFLGDAMMLAGASLAVTAIAVGYLTAIASPS
jgi:hypothetical protein